MNAYDNIPTGARIPDDSEPTINDKAHLPLYLVSWHNELNKYYVDYVDETGIYNEGDLATHCHYLITTGEWIDHVEDPGSENDLMAYMYLFQDNEWDDVKGTDFYYALGKKMGWVK